MRFINLLPVSVGKTMSRALFALAAAVLLSLPLAAQSSRQAPSKPAATAQRSGGNRDAYAPRAPRAPSSQRAKSANRQRGNRLGYVRRDGARKPSRPRYGGSLGYHGYYYPYGRYPYRYYHPYYLRYWWPYYWGGYWGPVYWSHRYHHDSGAIDINTRPKKTQIYLNGYNIGNAGRFDGLPGYLWLKKGTYEIIYYLEGYETVRKVYEIFPGVTLREKFRMQPGKATPPEELSQVPVAARIEAEQEAGYEDRAEAPRRYRVTQPRPANEADEGAFDLRGDPGFAKVSVLPSDASVYLDGRFLGTGGDLARRDGRVTLDPGKHRLQVRRPGYRDKDIEFVVQAAETTALDVALEQL